MLQAAFSKPLTKEQSDELLNQTGKNWLYGQAFGETILNIGGIILFPPYAAYVLTNAGLNLSGYESLKFSSLLPEPSQKKWEKGYDGITSIPGHTSALLADEKFRDKNRARMSIERVLETK